MCPSDSSDRRNWAQNHHAVRRHCCSCKLFKQFLRQFTFLQDICLWFKMSKNSLRIHLSNTFSIKENISVSFRNKRNIGWMTCVQGNTDRWWCFGSWIRGRWDVSRGAQEVDPLGVGQQLRSTTWFRVTPQYGRFFFRWLLLNLKGKIWLEDGGTAWAGWLTGWRLPNWIPTFLHSPTTFLLGNQE